MPELPEVETVRATLERQIVGEEIIDVDILCPRIIGYTDNELFKNKLIGEHINKMARYGKYLIFIFDHVSLISHLRMEGKYFLKHNGDEIVKHEHVIFKFKSGRELRYHDTRKFGTMELIDSTDFDYIVKNSNISKLGIEANSNLLTKEYLYEKLRHKKDAIKSALLDQSIIAGLGNIYVDEVLFNCKIHPELPANLITLDDCSNIINHSKRILDAAILAGGTTIRSYTSSLGVTGRFQLSLDVHTLAGEKCKKCGTIIEKTRVGGRGTYYCPKCQKKRGLIIGITGTIGSGKSAVSNKLVEDGYHVIDTDKISKMVANDELVLEDIKKTFGDIYVTGNILDRKALGKLIFEDDSKREELNNILHPLIKQEMLKEISLLDDHLIFVDVPLLFETDFKNCVNYSIMVYSDLETNINRLMKRDNITRDDAVKRLNSQMNSIDKKNLADFIIDNSQDLCYTYTQLEKIVKELEKK